MLLPPSLDEWLPSEHLVRFLDDLGEAHLHPPAVVCGAHQRQGVPDVTVYASGGLAATGDRRGTPVQSNTAIGTDGSVGVGQGDGLPVRRAAHSGALMGDRYPGPDCPLRLAGGDSREGATFGPPRSIGATSSACRLRRGAQNGD